MANWALIDTLNDQEIVTNIASASSSWADSQRPYYHYVLDTSNYSPVPQIGYIYDSIGDSFSAPVENYKQELINQLAQIDADIQQAVEFALNLSQSDISDACSTSNSTSVVYADANGQTTWTDLATYLGTKGS